MFLIVSHYDSDLYLWVEVHEHHEIILQRCDERHLHHEIILQRCEIRVYHHDMHRQRCDYQMWQVMIMRQWFENGERQKQVIYLLFEMVQPRIIYEFLEQH